MVRETRHLWVGNLPDNIREDRIREHFKRYGRVQNVKLLGRTESAGAVTAASSPSGLCATVAFMDIKSASKAHNAEHVLDERTLTTEYYEPAAIPPATGAPSAGSSPAGSGYSGSSSSVNSAPVPTPSTRYHLSGGEESTGTPCAAATAAAPVTWRGTNDSATEFCRRGNTPAAYGRYQRSNNSAPYSTPPSNVDRTPHHRWYAGDESAPSTPGGATEAGARRRRRSGSGGGSSRSDSSSPEPSDQSRASTPPAAAPTAGLNHRTTPNHQWASTASGRPLAICVRNLPIRSTDSSLKDGLYHEYKKHGKVEFVKVVGQNADRYAIVKFKKPSDVEKALEVSQDKKFFGNKISVAPHQSCDEDAESAKPYETDIDEYHPKATRTLFIGNLEKDVTQQQLRDKFKHFGRIIEIDIKKGSGGGAGYAFCQYASISSVVEAIRAVDGEYVGSSRVKLGFGKPVATTCVWVDGLTEHTEKQVLGAVARCGAATSVCVDRAAGAALVHFEQASAASAAVRELRRVAALAVAAPDLDHPPPLCVDYASRECQETFYEQLEKHGGSAALAGSERLAGDLSSRYMPSTRHDAIRYESGSGSRSRASSYGRGSSRTPRYSGLDHYDPAEYVADRRYRVYDELGSSPKTEDSPFEDRLQSVVVSPHRSRRHRRDSSPEDHKHTKEWHRSVSGGVVSLETGVARHRSRSGSGRRHRRRRDDTPLRDEKPAEPRRPPLPRDRAQPPMSLPLPKFAVLLRSQHPPPPPPPPHQPPAPASPHHERPPSVSSSTSDSAPHSPSLSLEERIRSLDEKYERWSRLDPPAPPPDRARLRHRLLELDVNEVKPSEVVRSLLAKRSVFDEDSERLEGTVLHQGVRPPLPPLPTTPRALQYPFPTHPPSTALSDICEDRPVPPNGITVKKESELLKIETKSVECANIVKSTEVDDNRFIRTPTRSDISDKPTDPRLNRINRSTSSDRLIKLSECEYNIESRIRLRTPSTEKLQYESDKKLSPKSDQVGHARDPRNEVERERRRRESVQSDNDCDKLTDTISEKKNETKVFQMERIDFQKDEPSSEVLLQEVKIKIEPSEVSQAPDIKYNAIEASKLKVDDVDKKPLVSSNTNHEQEDTKQINTIKKENEFDSKEIVKVESESTQQKSIDEEIAKLCHYDSCHEESKEIFSSKVLSMLETKSQFGYGAKQDFAKKGIENHIKIETSVADKRFELIDKKIDLHNDILKSSEKNGKERYNHSIMLTYQHCHFEKENIQLEKQEKESFNNHVNHSLPERKAIGLEKSHEDSSKTDRDKGRHRDRTEKEKNDGEKEKTRNSRDKSEKDKRVKEELINETLFSVKGEKHKSDKEKHEKEMHKLERDNDKANREKNDREDKLKHGDDKPSRHDHHRKDKYDKRKESVDSVDSKLKKEDRHKHERQRKDHSDLKRDIRKDLDSKSRKTSREELNRDLCRKDSTDSSTSRASHDSSKVKELDNQDVKEDTKAKIKTSNDKHKPDKESFARTDRVKSDESIKSKTEVKEEKGLIEHYGKTKTDSSTDQHSKSKPEITEKLRHYSVDSSSLENKRKERLSSCSSLPSHIGHKRRMSSQDSMDTMSEDTKKIKTDTKTADRRDSKDSRSVDRHKTTKFNKGHFAKLIESKTKDEKKNQVKPPDDNVCDFTEGQKEHKLADKIKCLKKSPHFDEDEKPHSTITVLKPEGLQNDIDFLATLELRSSEEDEKQKAMRKEMKEKKRLQQLQQIQELQMQHDALQQTDYTTKAKDEKKHKTDDKRKETAREKRISTDRKSKDEKGESKRRSRKQIHSSDTSDSDEPKKHSIFDIIDDEPTYISMYDKVKARSCKNMQKQEEEKRQEKIKAKFSQLKQSRAKREEKKRSSWDEDSDSDPDRKKSQKISMDSSSDDDRHSVHSKKCDKRLSSDFEFESSKKGDYFNMEEDSRNKLSRKNSRSRIMSDTSDDDTVKRLMNKSLSFNQIKKEMFSDSESVPPNCHISGFYSKTNLNDRSSMKEANANKMKKNSLLTLFGKSDSDDSKIKSFSGEVDYKSAFHKKSNSFSSESESMASNLYSGEVRRKHKKKQKRNKFVFSDDEFRRNTEELNVDTDGKHKHSDKYRRHSNKKEKRRDKIRESVETDESREDRSKLRKSKNVTECLHETNFNNTKKDGKMEDIFGPLSDDSDSEVKTIQEEKQNLTSNEFDSFKNLPMLTNSVDEIQLKDDNRRKKDRKRKEKRSSLKDDENSLDVDAVSKAIEARLFADTTTDDENRLRTEVLPDIKIKQDLNHQCYLDEKPTIRSEDDKKNHDRTRKDNREKRKKKKRSREDRQNRKDYQYLQCNKLQEIKVEEFPEDSSRQDTAFNVNDVMKPEYQLPDSNSPIQISSLPRLTESPPIPKKNNDLDSKSNQSDTFDRLPVDENTKECIEKNKETQETSVEVKSCDIEFVTETPTLTVTCSEQNKIETKIPAFDSNNDHSNSEDAVRSISNLEKETTKCNDSLESPIVPCKIDEKVEDKARAVISQEETEDAVAALLGESFGGNDETFSFHVGNDHSTNQMENTTVDNENMPEEDAEEMRRAVQNLNASEMEMKPDTPMSDNDLLLIDTDTEEADDSQQDATDKLPINIIATNQTHSNISEQSKIENSANAKSNPEVLPVTTQVTTTANIEVSNKQKELKQSLKHETVQTPNSTATPVITSLTLSNNKLRETQLLGIPKSQLSNKDSIESIPINVTASIIQLKPQSGANMQTNSTAIKPIIGSSNRVSAPYQVINHMIRNQAPNMQPPTIKIPESHIIYQKPQSIVLSPRMTIDPRLQSPKAMTQGDTITSPRLANMSILSTSPQSLNSVGMASPNNIQQRSPGHVTVVRMQQPPLSPLQTMQIPHGARAMVSPNRPNSVLVQTQGTPIHFNRLPVTPVLAPISKSMNLNTVQQNKGIGVVSSMIHQQKTIATDCRKNEQRSLPENSIEGSKIILSPTSLQSTNPTVMAQNRLISMQNALHVGNINSTLKISNKVLLNSVNTLNERKDGQQACLKQDLKKTDPNHISFTSSPIIHVAGVNSSSHVIQNAAKSAMIHDPNGKREQASNVIHSLNSQRVLTTGCMTNVIQIDANKIPTSVLSMSAIRTPTVLNKSDPSVSIVTTTSTMSNVVMTPLILKTNTTLGTVRISTKPDVEKRTPVVVTNNKLHEIETPCDENNSKIIAAGVESVDTRKELLIKTIKQTSTVENISKIDTDFEELLKDNTNEIKVTNSPDRKLGVNPGKPNTMPKSSLQSHDQPNLASISEFQVKNITGVDKCGDLTLSDQKTEIEHDVINEEPSVESDTRRPEVNVKPSGKENTLVENMTSFVSPSGESKFQDENNSKDDDKPLSSLLSSLSDESYKIKKQVEENDSWSAKDVNIESVIKKVDSLCNDSLDEISNNVAKLDESPKSDSVPLSETVKSMDLSNEKSEENQEQKPCDTLNTERITLSKRGGRSVRGKRSNKNLDKVQTRQISKPYRGGGTKRGRGRANMDKKLKDVSATVNNIPGDVYDFHEDSGDETHSSPNSKSESRPRLILTIKSPLSGQSAAVATSSLSITPKDQTKPVDKVTATIKDDKADDFLSPSANTRKSRRLQEKDVQRSTVDDVIEDVIKGSGTQTKISKDLNKKRPTRQAVGAKTNYQEKITGTDARKSPRGVKRTKDRSLSDASIDSSDEKMLKKDDSPKEPKIQKMTEPQPSVIPAAMPLHSEVDMPPQVPSQSSSVVKSSNTPVINTLPTTTPTPIMKPPKKMISEMSAKLASVFEEAASSLPMRSTASANAAESMEVPSNRLAAEADEPPAQAEGGAPGHALPPALEAADARVHSPALPHRPPSLRPSTPVLIRGAGGEGASVFRAGYAGTASLPRGAHHPPPPPPHHHHLHLKPPLHIAHTGSTARMNVTSVPHVSPQGQLPLGDGMYPHFSHQHYQMYQQHFRATQHDSRASPSPYTRSLEAEGSEAPTPPLELRRPPSARVPRPAHSPAPADRLIMYGAVGGRSPPPAHAHAGRAPPGALPPPAAPGPPHASQVPREADSLQMLLRRYPVMWQGLLALKNDAAAVQMHFVGGNPAVAGGTLPRHTDGSTPPLRIAQRMRLEPAQLDQVHRKMKMEMEHCILLALPCGRDHMDVLQQSTNLTGGFITYLQRKQAAGIVNVAPPGHDQAMYTVHIFPSCDFANENLNRIAPDLMHRVADIAHLLIVIATV